MSDDLIAAARAVWDNAYAPYSHFKVGAALRTPSGAVYVGCNVENVAYPEGTCAEAGAIAAMVAAGETELTEALVIADAPHPVSPCGGCRQKLAEFARHDVPVTMTTTGGAAMTVTIEETELIRLTASVTAHMAAHTSITGQASAPRTPAAVAKPLPPLNFNHGVKQCPATAPTAA